MVSRTGAKKIKTLYKKKIKHEFTFSAKQRTHRERERNDWLKKAERANSTSETLS